MQYIYVSLPWKPKNTLTGCLRLNQTGSWRWENWRQDWRQDEMPTRDGDTSETGRRWPTLDLVLHV